MSRPSSVRSIPRRWLGALFSLPLAFSLLLYALTLISEQTDDHLLSSQNLGSCVVRLHGLADEAQAAERSYLVTGDEDYLNIFRRANATLPSQVLSCNRAVDGRPADFRNQITEAERLVEDRFKEAQQVFAIQQALGFGSAIEAVKNNNSEATMNKIRATFGDLQSTLGEEQSEYRERQRSLTRFAYLSFIIGSLLLMAVMFWLYSSQLSNLHARDAANAELQRVNAELETRIEARTKDLM